MNNAPRNNNYYWNNGAFCHNCGILKGNVINNGQNPIWHPDCKPGCKSTWEDQDFSPCDEYEYEHILDEEERWNEAYQNQRPQSTGHPELPMEFFVNGYDEYDLILDAEEEEQEEHEEQEEQVDNFDDYFEDMSQEYGKSVIFNTETKI
jgi:hypothetical protein